MTPELPSTIPVQSKEKIKIELLGKLKLVRGNHLVVPTARKDQALLAFLANTPMQSQRRSRLAYLLWPESSNQRA